MDPPTGQQYDISHGPYRATITEVGATLRRLTCGEHDLIDGFGAGERSEFGRGQVLAPWPNRLREGSYRWDGDQQQLPLSEPAPGNAIHGLVRWHPWSPVTHRADEVVMTHKIHPRDGYPFLVELTVSYRLGPEGLEVTTTATNRGTSACPFGIGFHPYLRLGSSRVDDLELRLPARRMISTDPRGIPTGSAPVAGSEDDFGSGRAIAGRALDTAFGDLERDERGRATVVVRRAEGSPGPAPELHLWVDEGFDYLMVFTGDSLPPAQRRRALAVEPMTCPANAFATGESLVRLEPDRSFRARWGLVSAGRAPG